MKRIYRTPRFKKDVKRLKKQDKDFTTFKRVIELLAQGIELGEKYRDHKLIGNFRGKRECHITPDWLLVYEVREEDITLVRTGSHSELFQS